MVKKSVKKVAKKKVSRRPSKQVSSKASKIKINRYLLNSVILLAISIALYYASPLGLWSDVFYMGIIVFGSLSLAFVIVLLIQFFLKIFKK